MMSALKSTLAEILGSKKALMLIATVAAAAAARLGWHVSADALYPYEALAASYLLAQGIADHGKGAEEVKKGGAS